MEAGAIAWAAILRGRLDAAAVVPTRDSTALSDEGFEQLVRRHQRRIYRVLLGMLRDTDAAETLTQECFLRAYRHRNSFRGEASVETWLVRIAINLARDHVKNRRRAFWARLFERHTREDEPEGAALEVATVVASPEQRLAAREEVAAVQTVVDALPERQREVFLLRFVEEMTLAEIAQATGLEMGTVKSHLHRAVGTVRERMKSRTWHRGHREKRECGKKSKAGI